MSEILVLYQLIAESSLDVTIKKLNLIKLGKTIKKLRNLWAGFSA